MKFRVRLKNCHGIFLNRCLHPCDTPMAPNKFFHNLKQSLQAASLLIPCPACDRKFKSRGGLTKHLNQIHPDFEDDINEDASPVNSQRLGHSVSGRNAPDTPPQPQVQYPPSQAAPPPDRSSTHPNTMKKHHRYRFTFCGGFSKSYDSVDLMNPTDEEDYRIPTDDDDSPPSPSSHIAPPLFAPSPIAPASPENILTEDFWHMDVHHDPAPEDSIHSSHSSDTSTPTFSIQSHTPANRPTNHRQTAPKEHYSRIYHPKLNGVYLFLLFFTIYRIHVHLQGRYVT